MAIKLSNLGKGIHMIKCKYRHDNKQCETCIIKYNDCMCSLEYTNFIDRLKEYNCLCCNMSYQKKFDEILKKRLSNT